MQHSLELMKTVGPAAQDVQEQIDFAGESFSIVRGRQGCGGRAGDLGKPNKKQRQRRLALGSEEKDQWVSKMRNRLPGIIGATSPPLKPRLASVENISSSTMLGR